MKQTYLRIGLDIGGSKIMGLLYDDRTKKIYANHKQPIIKTNLAELINQIDQEIDRLLNEATKLNSSVLEIGLGVPGLIYNQKIVHCPNLQVLDNQNLARLLFKKFPKQKIVIDNDLNCFLRAYLEKHPILKKGSFAVIALGTGVGGSVALDGRNINAELGLSSELGHMIIDQKTGRDLEYYYHQTLHKTAGSYFELAQQNNHLAQQKVDQFAHALGIAMANLNNLINPKTIVLTGGVARYYKTYLPAVKSTMQQFSFTKNQPKWLIGHDQTAAAIGASLL